MQSPARTELIDRFQRVVETHRTRPAVSEAGRVFTYGELADRVFGLAAQMRTVPALSAVGIYAGRGTVSYAAMWAAIVAGIPYVPLNPALPDERIDRIIALSGLNAVVCAEENRGKFAAMHFAGRVFYFDKENTPGAPVAALPEPSNAKVADDTAYILFTSGSTGVPKGVPVSCSNLRAFIANAANVFTYRPDDRVAQVCETAFDFSVHEIYLALLNGACLYPARDIDLFNPVQFIQKNALTVWHSVPSLANIALRNSKLTSGELGSLRETVFNGEPLTQGLARRWQDVVGSGRVWNFYGPTECTVAVTSHLVTADDLDDSDNNICIGQPFADCQLAIDNEGDVVPFAAFHDGLAGELLIGGAQTFDGYLGNRESLAFVQAADGQRYYRSGDQAYWANGKLFLRGRLDYQVKIGGHRIELLEVEHRLKAFFATEMLAVVAVPAGRPDALALCFEGDLDMRTMTPAAVGLPAYMLPKRGVRLPALPCNANGKVDRLALARLAEAST